MPQADAADRACKIAARGYILPDPPSANPESLNARL
jgi:hypothetical protein